MGPEQTETKAQDGDRRRHIRPGCCQGCLGDNLPVDAGAERLVVHPGRTYTGTGAFTIDVAGESAIGFGDDLMERIGDRYQSRFHDAELSTRKGPVKLVDISACMGEILRVAGRI